MQETRIAERPGNFDSSHPFRTRMSFRFFLSISLVLIGATCYLRDFVLPSVPTISWADQTLFATNGARIFDGQMTYRDYFQFVTPGTDLVYALLFRCFGLWIAIPDALMVGLAVTAVLLMILAARRVLHGRFLALPVALTAGFILFGGMDATHHWFSAILAMTAMLVFFHGSKSWQIALAGALCGVAASFTQSRGALVTVGFVAWLIYQSLQEKESIRVLLRKCILFCGAVLLFFVAINGPYMAALGLRDWIKWVVVFPFRYYPTLPAQTWRAPWDDFRNQTGFIRWICIPFVYLTIPLVYFIFLRVMFLRRKIETNEPWNQLLLLAITGLAMFASVAPCLSVMRVSTASLPGMVLLAWLLNRWGRPGRIAAVALAAVSLAIAVYLPLRIQTMHWRYLDLPAGRAAIRDPNRYELYQWMAQHTHPGQMYFGIGPISLPLRLRTPAPIESPVPYEYDRPEHIAASIDAIERNRIPLLLLRPYLNLAGTWGYTDEHIRPFQAYIDQHYRRVKTFPSGDEAWERKEIP